MKVSELRPNPANPRKITDEQLSYLGAAMREFGDLSGLILNRTTGNLVGGHQRVKILGDATVTILHKYPKPTVQGTVAEGFVTYEGERFTYREVKWDEVKERGALIAANKQGGDFEFGQLTDLLLDLDDNNFDLKLTGFSMKELEEMVNWSPDKKHSIKSERTAGKMKETYVELINKWKTKRGQLWRIGEHRLLIDDVLDPDAWKRLGDSPYRFGMADPPYDQTFNPRPLLNFISGNLFSFLGDKQAASIGDKNFVRFFINTYEHPQGFDALQAIKHHHTLIAQWQLRKVKPVRGLKELTTVFVTDSNHDASVYASMDGTAKHIKPQIIMQTLMRYFTKPGWIIMDAYAGGGSTLIAAEKLKLKTRSMELNPDACAILLERAETEGLKCVLT